MLSDMNKGYARPGERGTTRGQPWPPSDERVPGYALAATAKYGKDGGGETMFSSPDSTTYREVNHEGCTHPRIWRAGPRPDRRSGDSQGHARQGAGADPR